MRQSEASAAAVAAAPGTSFSVSKAYLNYVLVLVWIVMLLRFVDIQIIAALLESIRREFSFSDTQLGLLSGAAFALFYGTLGIPVAWLADRYNRRNIMVIALGLWSAMTALCGLAVGFWSLFLARIGVGVGEAGGQPPAYSMMSDYFPSERRSSVFAILNTSVPAGVFTGFIVGGWVNEYYGWRAAFLCVGVPGVLLALLIRLTVREPPRGWSENRTHAAAEPSPGLKETLKYLWQVKTYRYLVLATSIFTLGAFGSGIWIPSFFQRVHGMGAAETNTWLAFIYGGGGVFGAALGGYLADHLARKTGDQRWPLWVSAIASISILPFSFFVYLWHDPIQALLVHTGTTTLMHMWMGPAYGTVQSLAGLRRRAMAAAINGLVVSLVAFGLGPTIIGIASDFFREGYGDDALRYSILAVVVSMYSLAALFFLIASRTVRRDLEVAAMS
jgi:MFS family permease